MRSALALGASAPGVVHRPAVAFDLIDVDELPDAESDAAAEKAHELSGVIFIP